MATLYGRQVFQTAHRLLGDKHLAEDIVQDVFLKLFKKDTIAYKKVENWPAYLKVMATSTSYDLLRKKSRQAEQNIEDSSTQFSRLAVDSSPEKQLMCNQNISHFRNALSKISPLEANVFSLRYIEEFSYQEIAEQLSITKGNVGITLSRAKNSLSKLLKNTNSQE